MSVAAETAVAAARFAFGELALHFESDDPAWIGYLHQRFGRFRSDEKRSAFVIRFEATSPPPDHLVSPLAVHLENVRCEPVAAGLRIATDTTDGLIDFRSRRALLRGPRAMYPLDNLLRHLLPILWEDGILVHAASIERPDGRGFLATGPSGAGKSTLSRLAAGCSLCDELSAVKIRAMNGHDPAVVALPFWESRPGSASLRAILCLAHGERHSLLALRPEEALRRITTQVLWPVWDEAAMARAFGSLSELVERVPAFDLRFRPTYDVWHFVDRELP